MRPLLGHLAQFASFYKQGEVLCTQGLAYLLQHSDASRALATQITKLTGVSLDDQLSWRAEAQQEGDRGRPDLEARTADKVPVVKVEAKLGAPFDSEQFKSYADDLVARSGGVLIVLVPRLRVAEATESVSKAFQLTGSGLWRLVDHPTTKVTVISWEGVLAALLDIPSEPLHSEVVQFEAMYRVLCGSHIEPLASRDELIAWRDREGVFVNLVDRVTRHLAAGTKLLPLHVRSLEHEPEGLVAKGYQLRYVCRPLGAYQPCFSIGVRDPFKDHDTPIWLRFHRETPQFSVIRSNIEASPISARIVESGGHIWIPLSVPVGADGEQMVETLIAQAEEVCAAGFRPSS
jgi:hypothetical protein